MSLRGKKLIVAVTGSIAVYKAAFLVRHLIRQKAKVRVIMTEAAKGFVAPLTFSTLSKNPVVDNLFDDGQWNNHVELGLWADAMIVAPATANTLAKMANGICDNMLLATYLSAKCPVFIAPAMDLDMWKHPSTRANLKRLHEYGNDIIDVGYGELASGLVGSGRMAEPEDIAEYVANRIVHEDLPLHGKRYVVTAGPTYEAIDPVRYIGNRSSGKMGVALAEALYNQGADVDLILGPSKVAVPEHIGLHRVESAADMYEEALKRFEDSNGAILAAAVSDFTPEHPADQKIKKGSSNTMQIDLVKTHDIAAELGERRKPGQILIGFALETNNALENARVKLKKKGFDFIVLNSLSDTGAGFDVDTNRITIIHKDNKTQEFQLKSKKMVAVDIVNELVSIS